MTNDHDDGDHIDHGWNDDYNNSYDMDDSGSMDTKELARLLFTLIDDGEKVIDDDNGDYDDDGGGGGDDGDDGDDSDGDDGDTTKASSSADQLGSHVSTEKSLIHSHPSASASYSSSELSLSQKVSS